MMETNSDFVTFDQYSNSFILSEQIALKAIDENKNGTSVIYRD